MRNKIVGLLLLVLLSFIDVYGQVYDFIPYRSGDKWGLVDDTMHMVLKPEFDEIRLNAYPNQTYYTTRKGSMYGLIIEGKEIVPCEMDSVQFYKRGVILNRLNNGMYNVYDGSGKLLFNDPVREIRSVGSSYAVRWQNGKGSTFRLNEKREYEKYEFKWIYENYDSFREVRIANGTYIYMENDTMHGYYSYEKPIVYKKISRKEDMEAKVTDKAYDKNGYRIERVHQVPYQWVLVTDSNKIKRFNEEAMLVDAESRARETGSVGANRYIGRSGRGFELVKSKDGINVMMNLYSKGRPEEKKTVLETVKTISAPGNDVKVHPYANTKKDDGHHNYYVDTVKGTKVFSDTYGTFVSKGKTGIVTELGIIPAQFDTVIGFGPFYREQPFFLVSESKKKGKVKKYGLIYANGTWKLPMDYDNMIPNPNIEKWRSISRSGEAFVLAQKKGKWVILNSSLDQLVAPDYDDITSIDNLFNRFSLKQGDRYGYFSTKSGGGNSIGLISEYQILGADNFQHTFYYRVYREGRFIGYIDAENNEYFKD